MKLTETAILCFAYNRPRHFERVIQSLRINKDHWQFPLIVHIDGPRSDAEKDQVLEVIKVAQSITGFASVTLNISNINLGLYRSITCGVSSVLNDYPRVIVLEDDIVVSPYFLDYMQSALDLYATKNEVAQIHAWSPNLTFKNGQQTFFMRGTDCWGWATWRDRWGILQTDASSLLSEIRSQGLCSEFNGFGAYDFCQMLEDRAKGLNQSWSILFHASNFLQHRFSLHPAKSLVLNIGHDGSGEHCSAFELSQQLTSKPIQVVDLPIESPRHIVQQYYSKMYPSSGFVVSALKAFRFIGRRILRIFRCFSVYVSAVFLDT